jgi:glyoxylase-like metal-dependent hydrolase (beta-lactamase superfamily II)
MKRVIAIMAVLLCLGFVGSAMAAQYEIYSIMYSRLENYPVDAILFATDRGKTMTLPFSYCLVKGGGHQYMFDTGYNDVALGMKWGAPAGAWSSIADNLRKLGTSPDQITDTMIGHMHWDHAGGTSDLPASTFWVQKKEIEFAAGEITQKKHTMAGFVEADVLAMVRLNWEGRVRVVKGDEANILPGISLYLTPGHTAGTQTAAVPTRKGIIPICGDTVYTYRNLNENIPLGFGYDLVQMLNSYDKVRQIMGTGKIFVPGHDPDFFNMFPKVADNIVRVD